MSLDLKSPLFPTQSFLLFSTKHFKIHSILNIPFHLYEHTYIWTHSRSSLLFLCSTIFYHGHKRGLHDSKNTIPPSLSYPGLSVSTGEKIHSFLSPYSNFLLTGTHFCFLAVLANDHFFKKIYIKLINCIYIYIHTCIFVYFLCV